jgi:hypothetical protein
MQDNSEWTMDTGSLTVKALEVLHTNGATPAEEMPERIGCDKMEFLRAGIALTMRGKLGIMADYDGSTYSLTADGKKVCRRLFQTV